MKNLLLWLLFYNFLWAAYEDIREGKVYTWQPILQLLVAAAVEPLTLLIAAALLLIKEIAWADALFIASAVAFNRFGTLFALATTVASVNLIYGIAGKKEVPALPFAFAGLILSMLL